MKDRKKGIAKITEAPQKRSTLVVLGMEARSSREVGGTLCDSRHGSQAGLLGMKGRDSQTAGRYSATEL